NNYGSFLYKQKRYREALVQFSKASTDLEYDRRALAFSNVGRCQAELGDYNAAETAFARAITLDPNSPGPYYALARIAKEKREYQAALQLLSQYHSLRPATPPSLDMQIQIARALGDKNLEASAMLKLKNIYPNSRQYRVYQRGGQL
ncbi:MAG: tetratricopeptide repeat protein, partial [Cellvibrionaceae bacterium]|nr:tetratricopeptide repeat protein [Cellvibrionaceae bacterium]